MTPAQQMIAEAFNSQTYVDNRMDVQHTPIYDTVTIAQAGAINETTTAFFTNVGAASGKTLALTNMTQSQKLPAPEAFSIFGFRLRISENTTLADWYILFNTFALEFWLGQKVYQRAPLWYFSSGGGVTGAELDISMPAITTGSSSAQTGQHVINNGVPMRESMHKLAIPIVIENQMTFYARLVGTANTATATGSGGVGIIMQLLLDGFYALGVQ